MTIAEPSNRQSAMAFCENRDIRYFSYIALGLPVSWGKRPEDTLQTSYPAEWIGRYVENSYVLYDPVVSVARKSRLPFRWGHGGFISGFKKAERRVFHEAREFQIREGYSIPLYGPDGETAIFTVISDKSGQMADMVEASSGEIQLFAGQFHAAQMELLRPHGKRREEALSGRERECLLWTADGLTSDRIAKNIGLSTSAINHNLGTAARKLGAANKLHATVLALRRGLI